jgi:hypothetical protein
MKPPWVVKLAPIGRRLFLFEIDFEREPVPGRPSGGHNYVAWSSAGVPRINDELMQSIIYLYPSRDAAERGEAAGGTGFLVSYTSDKFANAFFLFAVSNKHVVCDGGSSVIRVNTLAGGVDIFEFEPHQWYSTNDHDLAIMPVKLDLAKHRIKAADLSFLLTIAAMKTYDIGPGDEVFMIGRFANHDGKIVNTPSVRFGNLSMMVDQIDHPYLGTQESFAVEMRSMGGYSGSPVFVYPSAWNMNTGATSVGGQRLFLLGVDWGHITHHSEVKEKLVTGETQSVAPLRKVLYVAANTGMNGVVPAWRLAELVKNNPWTAAIEAEAIKLAASEDVATHGIA